MTLLLDSNTLRTSLQAIGLDLHEVQGVPKGFHPVCLDFWRVEDGQVESGEIGQHEWSQASGAAIAAATGAALGATAGGSVGALRGARIGAEMGARLGPMASWWGTSAGWLAGGYLGLSLGIASGATRAAPAGRDMGRRWSERVSGVLGTYNEVLVGVPNVFRQGRGETRYVFVPGMFSDSFVSIWGDRTLRCGYQKRKVTIVREQMDAYDVAGPDDLPILSASFVQSRELARNREVKPPGMEIFRDWFAQPLLGHLGERRFAVTFLDRFLDDPRVDVVPISGKLAILAPLGTFLPQGRFAVQPLSAQEKLGAFRTIGLPVRVTYPVHPGPPTL